MLNHWETSVLWNLGSRGLWETKRLSSQRVHVMPVHSVSVAIRPVACSCTSGAQILRRPPTKQGKWLGGGFKPPLWKVWVHQLGWFFWIYGKKIRLPCSKPRTRWWFNDSPRADNVFSLGLGTHSKTIQELLALKKMTIDRKSRAEHVSWKFHKLAT